MTGFLKVPLNLLIEELGEDKARDMLSGFSCPLNNDIESFLRRKAIEFEKQGLSRTKLIYASYKNENVLVGYYTLAYKSFNITRAAVSNSVRKRITKYATYDTALRAYILPAPLIAQLGKNFTNNYNDLISGDELLKLAFEDIILIQNAAGGKIAYLECEDKPKLIDFYSENGFVEFAKRSLDKDETELNGKYLIQMLRVFKNWWAFLFYIPPLDKSR